MARGRKRKTGKRTKSGQLSRAGTPITAKRDTGTERAREKYVQYGGQGGDPIGRAFAMGLLGEGDEAAIRRDVAKRYNQAFWCEMPKPYPRCALDVSPRGGDADQSAETVERVKALNKWLNQADMKLRRNDMKLRQSLHQFAVEFHPDYGPTQLDAMIWAKKHGLEPKREDAVWLNRVCSALDVIA